jgi:hypothetical protein
MYHSRPSAPKWRCRRPRPGRRELRNGYADDGGAKIVKEFRIYLDYRLPLL